MALAAARGSWRNTRLQVSVLFSQSSGVLRILFQPLSLKRSEEHTSELQSLAYLVCRLLLEKKKKIYNSFHKYRIFHRIQITCFAHSALKPLKLSHLFISFTILSIPSTFPLFVLLFLLSIYI